MKNSQIENCLRAIAKKNGGRLLPEHVVAEARSRRHPLHCRFTWDDDEASEQWRLHEARMLINVCVEVLADNIEPSPVFVSLTSDRMQGRGYRVTADVMSDAGLRDQLLKDALHELNRFQRKYSTLKALAQVFVAIRKVKKAA